MHKSKLITVLRSLSTRERSRWREYVYSPFFNKHPVLRDLADLILGFAPEFTEKMPDKGPLYAQLYGPDTEFDERKLNNQISDLYELLLGFLSYTLYESEPVEQQLLTVNALLERNLDHAASGALAKCRLLLDRRTDQTARRHFLELRWWEAAEVLASRESRRIAGEQLNRQAKANDLAFVLEKLRLGAAMLSRRGLAVVQADAQPRWLPAIRQWCQEEADLAEMPAVQVYLAALDLQEQAQPESFAAFTEALDQHYAVFGKEELAALYQYALNYCIRRINDGQPDAYPQALNLYQTLLERDVLLRQGRLSQWTYKNITTTGLRSGAFGWTEGFLKNYRELLPPGEQENAFAYNLAALHFEKKNYAATLLTLQNVEFTDFTYHLGAKILQLKSYYLLEETEALNALLEATQQLLRRNRSLSSFGKSANLNFIRMLRQLHRWKQGADTKPPAKQMQRRKVLAEKIEQLQPLANKDWLQEMLVASNT